MRVRRLIRCTLMTSVCLVTLTITSPGALYRQHLGVGRMTYLQVSSWTLPHTHTPTTLEVYWCSHTLLGGNLKKPRSSWDGMCR